VPDRAAPGTDQGRAAHRAGRPTDQPSWDEGRASAEQRIAEPGRTGREEREDADRAARGDRRSAGEQRFVEPGRPAWEEPAERGAGFARAEAGGRPGWAEPAEQGEWEEPGDAEDWAQPARKRGGKRRRAPRLVAIGTSMVLALALVAAGVWWFVFREPGVPPADYAKAVCSSVRDWQQGVDGRSAALTSSISQQDDREAIRSAVRAYYGDLADRTDGLRTAVTGAGVVDVDGGKEYSDSFAGVVGDQASALRELAGRADRLDPASPSVFQIELQTLLTGAQISVGKVTAALARPPSGTPTPLRTALSAEPSCAPYVG
jgi:hypothetical protein